MEFLQRIFPECLCGILYEYLQKGIVVNMNNHYWWTNGETSQSWVPCSCQLAKNVVVYKNKKIIANCGGFRNHPKRFAHSSPLRDFDLVVHGQDIIVVGGCYQYIYEFVVSLGRYDLEYNFIGCFCFNRKCDFNKIYASAVVNNSLWMLSAF